MDFFTAIGLLLLFLAMVIVFAVAVIVALYKFYD